MTAQSAMAIDSRRVQFADFIFDGEASALYREGTRVHLQEQPAQVLGALLERPGAIVTRDALRERLWKSDTFVDFEHGLNTAVKKLRQALGDAADAPSFIETVPRRGYRFVAPVTPVVTADADPGPQIEEPAAPVIAHGGRTKIAVGWVSAIAALSLVAGLAWRAQSWPAAFTPAPVARSTTQLAVLPFRVLGSSDQSSDYLGVGIADAITTRLAGTRQIGVRPTSAVLPFRTSTNPADVAAALAVEHVLTGTIQETAQGYRVTVQLVKPTGVAVWGQTYDQAPSELLGIQDAIAEQLVSALRIELAAPERARLHARSTTNPEAHDHYLRGRRLLLDYTESKMRSAIEHFEQALALDPNYALARAGIATASAWFSVRYAHQAEEVLWAKRADEEAKRSLSLDGTLAEAHLAVASAAGTPYGGYDWTILIDRSAAALALNPSLEVAHLARMRAFYHLGLFEAAASEGRAAVRLNPTHSVELDRLEVALLLFSGQFQPAVDRATTLLQRTDAPAVRHYLGLARYYTGDGDGARALLASIMRGGRPDTRAQASLASIEAAQGRRGDAEARLATILRAADADHHVAYSVGAAFAQLRNTDASLDWLERAVDSGFPCSPWLELDTLLDPVRKEPRFARLVARAQSITEKARHQVD